jgi:hypothetical protein
LIVPYKMFKNQFFEPYLKILANLHERKLDLMIEFRERDKTQNETINKIYQNIINFKKIINYLHNNKIMYFIMKFYLEESIVSYIIKIAIINLSAFILLVKT